VDFPQKRSGINGLFSPNAKELPSKRVNKQSKAVKKPHKT